MRMTLTRVLFFLTFILMLGLLLQQCWQSKTPSEKWLYFFGESARDYAGTVLGQGRGTDVPVPEELSHTSIEIFDSFVTFKPNTPGLVLAFSPGVPPPAESGSWFAIGDGWYVRNGSEAAQ